MVTALLALPLIAGLAAFIIKDDTLRRKMLVSTAAGHSLLAAALFVARFYFPCTAESAPPGTWFSLDSLGLIFMGITSFLFLGAAIYCVSYLALEKRDPGEEAEEGFIFNNAPEPVFTGCLLLFLAAMTAVAASRHLGILWAAVEATTLLSAPLIYFHRHKRSLEATWKYLLICSVGIALALMGNLFLGAAGLKTDFGLNLDSLLGGAALLDRPLLKAAFLFLFVGYGTKMGLAPFHTWLPDAHSEAPAVVSALLSGALLNCAFLGILRIVQICAGAGLADFCGGILVLFGLLSLITAGLFILGQRDYKRLLAYSSIEHMGIMALGTGLGGGAVYGALLNSIGHSLTKAGLFFTSGLILAACKTKNISDVKGLLGRAPKTAALWLTGLFLITGTPPSGIFLGKFLILREAIASGKYLVAGVYLCFLAIIFAGMARIFIDMTFGVREAQVHDEKDFNELPGMIWPAAILFICAVALGLYVPGWLDTLLNDARALIGRVL